MLVCDFCKHHETPIKRISYTMLYRKSLTDGVQYNFDACVDCISKVHEYLCSLMKLVPEGERVEHFR